MKANLFSIIIVLFWQVVLSANPPQGRATRITQKPHIDGLLTDECWKDLPIFTDFLTVAPVAGRKSQQRSEVRFAYDDDAIYVSAYMHDTEPRKIDRQLYPRDGYADTETDYFALGLDTYNDNQNAFRFNVSASGVQGDFRISPDNFDPSWDAVWESKVAMQSDGWSVEIRVPYSAIRFPKSDLQTWGVQFVRTIRRYNEIATWAPVNPQIKGFVNQWGDMTNIEHIKPPLRLSLSPYIAGNYTRTPLEEGGFDNAKTANGGLDIKYGINESFTLDMTLIPNFGQVQSDNKVRNLSPFEVQYDERRPFFTEGIELFNKSDIFYSRRIGGEPIGARNVENLATDDETVVNNPSETQLYNATKFSGRTKGQLGVGVINAVASPMYATLKDNKTGQTRRVQTGYLSNYNIFVIDQILKNNSSISFTNTNVTRGGGARDGNVSALQFNLRDKKNIFDFSAKGVMSSVRKHDENPWEHGYKLDWTAAKIGGNFLCSIGQEIMDNKYNINDLGLINNNNEIKSTANVEYNWYEPWRNIQNRNVSFSASYTSLFQPRLYQFWNFEANSSFSFENQSSLKLTMDSQPFNYYDYYEPRVPGKKLARLGWFFVGATYGSDIRKRLSGEVFAGIGESPLPKDTYISVRPKVKWRANNRLQFTMDTEFLLDRNNPGAVSWYNPDSIVIGRRRTNTIVNTLATSFAINSLMNVTFRARHYWNQLTYLNYWHLNDDGSQVLLDTDYHKDENYNLFNIDMVYTWQFAPGSFLNIIWKNAIQQADEIRADRYSRNIRKTFENPQNNSFTLKMIYYLDYANVKKVFKK